MMMFAAGVTKAGHRQPAALRHGI